MSNDEKILLLLEGVITRLDKLETDVGELKNGQAELKADVTTLKVGQAKLQSSVAGLQEGQQRIREDIAKLHGYVVKHVWDSIDNLDARVKIVEEQVGIR